MSDVPHGRDDDGYFGALDFGDEVGTDNAEQSTFDGLDTDEATEIGDAATVQAIEILSEDTDQTEVASGSDDSALQLVTVTNPAETVSVSAKTGGHIHRIELSPEAVGMTASELATEVLAIAHVAQERGKAAFQTVLLGAFNAHGVTDNEVLGEFLEEGMGLPSPAKAAKLQAEVFAARYGG